MQTIFLFTDFTLAGPYVGQVHARLGIEAPGHPVVDLMHDAPPMRPDLASLLLPAVCRDLPVGSVVVAVVDPGVGGARAALWLESEGRLFVGPDNGLLARLPSPRQVHRVEWRPRPLSASFHGRDLFAPVAARLVRGEPPDSEPIDPRQMVGADWPRHQAVVVYIDGYGNAMVGIDAEQAKEIKEVRVGGRQLAAAETFSAVAPGEPFWYWNSQGLLEIAVNGGAADQLLSLALGAGILVD